MRQDVLDILNNHNLKVELKGYKEMPASDGYHMRGNLYVNGKRALLCEDEGRGGELNIDILNQKNAKPLLDIIVDLNKLKAYPGDKTIGDLEYQIDNMFYTMAEDFLELKDMKRRAKKAVLVKFKNKKYETGEFTIYKNQIVNKPMMEHLLKTIQNEKTKIEIWNIEEKWVSYGIRDLQNLIKTF